MNQNAQGVVDRLTAAAGTDVQSLIQSAIRLIESLDRQLKEARAEIEELKNPPPDENEPVNVSLRLKKQYINMFATRGYIAAWVTIRTVNERYVDATVMVQRKHIESVRKYSTHMEIVG